MSVNDQHNPSNKKACIFCNKLISAQNMSVHVKRCKVSHDCNYSSETMMYVKQLNAENQKLKEALQAKTIAFDFLNEKYDSILSQLVNQYPKQMTFHEIEAIA